MNTILFKDVLRAVTEPGRLNLTPVEDVEYEDVTEEVTRAISPLRPQQEVARNILFDFEEFLHLNQLEFNKDSINLFVKNLGNEPSAAPAS